MAQLLKNLLYAERPGFDPRVGKIPWRRERLLTPVFWSGEFHGHPWGCKELDTTEQLSLSLGGHGSPLQYSFLENPMGKGARWATVHRVAKSQTQLK